MSVTTSQLKEIKLKGVDGTVTVNQDGTDIIYKGKKLKSHLIKSKRHSKGYYACSINGKSFYIHRIIAEAWVSNPRPIYYKMVIHKNGNTLDNNYKNLLWGDAGTLYKTRVKLNIPGIGMNRSDKTYRGSSSISYEDALKIARRLDSGELAKDICKEYNVSEMSIARIRKRYCKQKAASPRYNKDIKQTVYKLSEKYPATKIAEITGIKYHTVYRWLKNKSTSRKKKNVVKITHLGPK